MHTNPPSLDPADWNVFRSQAHTILDDALDGLEHVRGRAVWQGVPAEVRARFDGPVPRAGAPLAKVYAEYRRAIEPYPYGTTHPRFWGWVNGSGIPTALLADLLATARNDNVGAFDQAGTFVERQVLAWLKQLLGFPEGTGGVLTSGASLANLTALGAMRNEQAGFDVRGAGVRSAERVWTVYGSRDTHFSVDKALEVLGFGARNFRRIGRDVQRRIDLVELEARIAEDRAAGFQPVCVVGTAGSVQTGAVDDLEALADLCEREGLWLHVDGAIGAIARIAPSGAALLGGLERADSVAFDLHKWLFLPNDVGCVFVRDGDALTRSYSQKADYLAELEAGPTALPGPHFMDQGLELTRRFRALKVWFVLRNHGVDALAAAIERNFEQARELARLVDEHGRLELLAPVATCVVCFRYASALDRDGRNALNRAILARIQESGLAMPSHTEIDGEFALRVAITNHRSELSDFEFLVAEAVRHGDELSGETTTIGGIQRCS